MLEGPKFRYPTSVALAIERELLEISECVIPEMGVDAIQTDPDDNRVLECALAAQAHAIISGDRHLFELGEFNGIRILTIAEILLVRVEIE